LITVADFMGSKRYWVIGLILFILLSCQSQWKSEKEDVAYWNAAVVDTAFKVLYQDKHPDRARVLFDSLLQANDRTSPYVEACRYTMMANYNLFFTQDNAATSRYIDSALAIYQKNNKQEKYPRTYVGLLIFGGEMAFRQANYSKSNEYFFLAKQLSDRYLDPCERSGFTYNAAMVSYRQQNFTQSAAYFKEAFTSQATCPVQTTAIVLQQQEILSNIGLCLLKLKQYDSAEVYFNKSLQLSEHYKDSLGPIAMDKIKGVYSGNLAKVHLVRGNLQEAEQLFTQSIALNSRPGYEITDALMAQVQLAEVYQKLQQYLKMKITLQAVRNGLDSLPNNDGEVAWRHLMADYFRETNQPLEELRYYKKYVELNDSITQKQKQLIQADISQQLKGKEQNLYITVLTKNNQLNKIYLWTAILLSVMGAIIVILIYQNYRRSKRNVATLSILNNEIYQQKSALELANKEKDRILQVVAHDLRSPIGSTVYLADLALMEEQDEKTTSLLESIKSASKKALHLTNELLGIRNGENLAGDNELVNLAPLVKEAVQLLYYKAAEKGQIIEIKVAAENLVTKGLPDRLSRMVNNLVENAIKFSPLQGKISVQLEKEQEWLLLTVSDNGLGIAKAEQHQVFDRFTKARRRGTSGEKSFGIGLSICQDIVLEHQGSIELESETGKGTSFFIRLPLADNV
jgi:signal transduction histidine kinase